LHGGFLMSFIDMSMFAFIAPQLELMGAVTLSCATDFLGSGMVGQPIDATGEILKETGKMIFVRGLLRQGDNMVCSFTGTMRKIPRPAREPAPS
jgi:acyl-coenzyme A thioesterase PaaI-like protein